MEHRSRVPGDGQRWAAQERVSRNMAEAPKENRPKSNWRLWLMLLAVMIIPSITAGLKNDWGSSLGYWPTVVAAGVVGAGAVLVVARGHSTIVDILAKFGRFLCIRMAWCLMKKGGRHGSVGSSGSICGR